MKPSTLRYIRTEQDVWSLLWRIMPKAVKELKNTRKTKIPIQFRSTVSNPTIKVL